MKINARVISCRLVSSIFLFFTFGSVYAEPIAPDFDIRGPRKTLREFPRRHQLPSSPKPWAPSNQKQPESSAFRGVH